MSEHRKSASGKQSYVCANCEKPFLRWPGAGRNRYCSRPCHYQHVTKMDQDRKRRDCAGCGIAFSPVLPGTRFCGLACAGLARRKPETVKCPHCGGKKSWGSIQCRPCENKARITGSESSCEQCGAPVWQTSAKMRKYCGQECFGAANQGENNTNFVHGKWTDKYPIEFWRVRLVVRKRDGKACLLCHGRKELHTHHIDRNRHNNEMSNLVTLCRLCHQAQHGMLKKSIPLSNQMFLLLSETYGYPLRSITSQ